MKKILLLVCMVGTLKSMAPEPGEHGQPLLLPLFEKIMKSFAMCGPTTGDQEVGQFYGEHAEKMFKTMEYQPKLSVFMSPTPNSQASLQKVVEAGEPEIFFHVQKTEHDTIIFFCKEVITQ